jgi:acyl transferase domain-containing protein
MWKPVNFVQSSQTAIKIGAKVFLEIGGKPLLGPMLEENSQGSKDLTFLQSLKPDTSNMETMFTSLAKLFTLGYDVNWDGFYKDSKVDKIK